MRCRMAKAIVCDRCGAIVKPVQDAKLVTLAELCKNGEANQQPNLRAHLCSACAVGFKTWHYQPTNERKAVEDDR